MLLDQETMPDRNHIVEGRIYDLLIVDTRGAARGGYLTFGVKNGFYIPELSLENSFHTLIAGCWRLCK